MQFGDFPAQRHLIQCSCLVDVLEQGNHCKTRQSIIKAFFGEKKPTRGIGTVTLVAHGIINHMQTKVYAVYFAKLGTVDILFTIKLVLYILNRVPKT